MRRNIFCEKMSEIPMHSGMLNIPFSKIHKEVQFKLHRRMLEERKKKQQNKTKNNHETKTHNYLKTCKKRKNPKENQTPRYK